MMKNALRTEWVVTALLVASCSGGAQLESGVDGSKPASMLTDAEAQSLCNAAIDATNDFASAHKAGFCKFQGGIAGAIAGAFGGDANAACEMAVDTCEAEDEAVMETQCDVRRSDCTATVAEIEACFNESLSALEGIFNEIEALSCSELLQSDGGGTSYDQPAPCDAVQSKCSGLDLGGIGLTDTSTS